MRKDADSAYGVRDPRESHNTSGKLPVLRKAHSWSRLVARSAIDSVLRAKVSGDWRAQFALKAWQGPVRDIALNRRILVPLDGSERAERGLPHVRELSLRSQAEVILISVVEPPELVEDIILYQEETERRPEEARRYLGRLQEDLGQQRVEAEIRVAHGAIVRKILESSKGEEAELIAMASHGRTGLARVFYGSVAAGVLHGTDRPLLLVRSMEAE